jgi:hypothetical protein
VRLKTASFPLTCGYDAYDVALGSISTVINLLQIVRRIALNDLDLDPVYAMPTGKF